MTVKLTLISSPLPECNLCEQPTKRDVHQRNGGLCSNCNTGIRQIARLIPLFPEDKP